MKSSFLKSLSILYLLLQACFTLPAIGQAISSVVPGSSSPGRTIDVLIRGSGTSFENNVSKASFGADINVIRVSVQDAQTAIASIQISNTAVPGFRDVIVTTRGQVLSLPNAFEIFPAGATFRATLEVLPVENITLADFDPATSDKAPVLFFVNVFNDNTQRKISIDILFSAASKGLLGTLYKKNIPVAPNAFLRVSRKEFTDFTQSGNAVVFFREVMALGTFPPDDYTYTLEVRDEQGRLIGSDVVVVPIQNKNYNPELIYPGNDFANEVQPISSPFPLFQWFGKHPTFDFALYQVRPGQTPEDVVRNLPVFKLNDVKTNSLVYPVYAEKLKSGVEYAWQVRGQLSSAKGVKYLPSEVFRFVYDENGLAIKGLSKITIIPQEIDLNTGQQFQFNAQLLDKNNNVITGVIPQWQITPSKGVITQNGLYTAGNEASTLAVLVKAGGITDFATVTVKGNFSSLFNLQDISIEKMIRLIFGLPPKL
jgi:hypothetical protein